MWKQSYKQPVFKIYIYALYRPNLSLPSSFFVGLLTYDWSNTKYLSTCIQYSTQDEMLILFSHHLVNTGFYTFNVSEQLLIC